jgi:hypothetical protein
MRLSEHFFVGVGMAEIDASSSGSRRRGSVSTGSRMNAADAAVVDRRSRRGRRARPRRRHGHGRVLLLRMVLLVHQQVLRGAGRLLVMVKLRKLLVMRISSPVRRRLRPPCDPLRSREAVIIAVRGPRRKAHRCGSHERRRGRRRRMAHPSHATIRRAAGIGGTTSHLSLLVGRVVRHRIVVATQFYPMAFVFAFVSLVDGVFSQTESPCGAV